MFPASSLSYTASTLRGSNGACLAGLPAIEKRKGRSDAKQKSTLKSCCWHTRSAMKYEDDLGQPVVLGPRLGSGGEANIHAVYGRPDLVAKIYFQPTRARLEKLRRMIASPPTDPSAAQGHVSTCWPKRQLFVRGYTDSVGFLMQKIDYSTNRPVFMLYNPMNRREVAPGFTWDYLLRTAVNIANVVDAIHDCGYVIGDLNESNFLVSDRVLVTLIDCDSMQVPNARGGVFRCTVGKPEFTAPELQGADFRQIDREKAHDNFALGVMMFYLLMEGVHPFAGIWQGSGPDLALEQRILRGESPYVGNTNVAPMPFAMAFEFLPHPLRTLFVRCFGYGRSEPALRPAAHEWRQALNEAEEGLAQCAINRRHIYPKHNTACPWCDRTELLGWRDPFPVSAQQPLRARRFTLTPASIAPAASAPPSVPFPSRHAGTSTSSVAASVLHIEPPTSEARPLPSPSAAPVAARKSHILWMGTLIVTSLFVATSSGWSLVQDWFRVPPAAPPVTLERLAAGERWSGSYHCPNGDTTFRLNIARILPPDASGQSRIEGDIHFVQPTGGTGAYRLSGSYDPGTETVVLRPAGWIQRPPRAVPVGMAGHLEEHDASLFGHVDSPECGGFDLKKTTATENAALPSPLPGRP